MRREQAYPFPQKLAIWNKATTRYSSTEAGILALLQLFWESAICKVGAFLYIMAGMLTTNLICCAFFVYVPYKNKMSCQIWRSHSDDYEDW
jgi:hypothetical protein